MCLWDCFPPSEVPVVTGVVLGVGLSMALVTLVFFLHSNATWSLHSLWQFMPQSERQRERERQNTRRVRTGTGDEVDSCTDFSLKTDLLCKCRLSELCNAYCQANK